MRIRPYEFYILSVMLCLKRILLFLLLFYILNKVPCGKLTLRKIDKMRRTLSCCSEDTARCGEPAGVSAHYLNDCNRFKGIHRTVTDYLRHCGCNILSSTSKARSMIRAGEIIVDRFGNANHLYLYAL